MYKAHNFCRACGYGKPSGPPGIKSAPSGQRLVEVFDLGVQPLANDFCGEDDEHEGFAPLKVLFCPECSLAQLSVVVNPEQLYSKYNYVTSNTQMMFDHFEGLWMNIRNEHPKPENVLEIGSNDGTLLKFLRDHGAESVIGIDPAQNLVEKAEELGVRTICSLFDEPSATMVASAMPRIDVVIARHVFCHTDDWKQFIKDLDVVCQKDTLVAIEVPYVLDLLSEVQFDTIYHEHLSYMNVKAMVALLDRTMFKLHSVQHFPIHSGAIVMYLRRRDFEAAADPSVEVYLDREKRSLTAERWSVFAAKAYSNIAELKKTVLTLKGDGKTICGFGASAKSTVWVNACGFKSRDLKFITDTTPQKQFKKSPGSDIPIVDQGALLRDLPDYAVLFAWNYAGECIRNNQMFIDKGGKFIIPVPRVHIVP